VRSQTTAQRCPGAVPHLKGAPQVGLLELAGKELQVKNIFTEKSRMFMKCKEAKLAGKFLRGIELCKTVANKRTL